MANKFQIFFTACLFLLFSSCIPNVVPPEALLDTPSRHVKNGMKFLRAGKIEAPYLEFKRALELDEEYAPAHVGVGLVFGLKGDYPAAMERLAIASLYTRDRLENALVHVGYMRVFLMGREKITQNWLIKIEERYKKAIVAAPESPDAYFFMGLAYKMNFMFDKASDLFLQVVEMDKDYAQEASEENAIIKNFERKSSS
jgi:lipoprotein NlpI